MKLYIPAGLENSDMKERLSPIIGHPKVPGIASISFGEALFVLNRTSKTTKTNTNNITINMINSILDCVKSAKFDEFICDILLMISRMFCEQLSIKNISLFVVD